MGRRGWRWRGEGDARVRGEREGLEVEVPKIESRKNQFLARNFFPLVNFRGRIALVCAPRTG